MAQFQFDASQHASQMNFDALPKGWYKGHVIESKARETAAKGQALDFVIEILEPAFAKGRKVFVGFNVVHPTSADTVRIAHEQLAALSIAAGHPRWNQTEELHNKPFHIKLKIEKAAEGTDYEDRNIPNGYDSITVHRALAVQPTAPGGQAPAAAFPGAQAPSAPVAPQQQFAAPQAPVAPQQPQAPVQQPAPQQAAPQQPWTPPAQPTQPWEQPAQQAPVQQPPVTQQPPVQQQPAPVQQPQEPVKSPEQIAWEQQQAAQAAAAQQPVQQTVQQPVQQPEAQPQGGATPPWATQTAQPAPQQAAPAQQPQAPAEPPHPAQAAVPPWQQPTA